MFHCSSACVLQFGVLCRLLLLSLMLALALAGCASLANRASERVTGNLATAMLDQDDPETVREGLPAYLLLLDGLIEGSPESAGLLLSGARLYGAYAGGFVSDPLRAKRLSSRALGYASRGICARDLALCGRTSGSFDEFRKALDEATLAQADALHVLGAAWATWLQAHREDWDAIAELPKIEALFEHLIALQPAHAGGEPHMYLGVLYCLRPEALGGRPQLGRDHFLKARDISDGKNLMASTLFAEHYARLLFDRELHDQLLQAVLEAEPRAPGLTLSNTLAQQRARALLETADDYF